MWYFAWILGVTAALSIAVINVMWYEFQNAFETDEPSKSDNGGDGAGGGD
jgi:cyd operon protein YbgT